jgi:hypothetical protein
MNKPQQIVYSTRQQDFSRSRRLLRLAAYGVGGSSLVLAVLLLLVNLTADGASATDPLPPLENSGVATLLGVILLLVIGLGMAGLLFGLSVMLESIARLSAVVIAARHHTHDGPVSPDHSSRLGTAESGAPIDASRVPWEEILMILRDTRENTLLTEEERRDKAVRVEQQEMAETKSILERLCQSGDFPSARERLAEMERKYPGRPALNEWAEHIERARSERERLDIDVYTRRVDEYITISAWQRARETVAEFQQRYPESGTADQLAARVEREFEVYDDAQRTRMYAEIQRYVSRRRWREALMASHTFIERFPHRSEADALRLQLDTLAVNADIQTRQELEAEITELAKRGQYADAEALARQVVEQFPDSPTAEILRSQLDRLHELATNPNAPPPRVRPSGVSSSSGFLPLRND